MSYAAIITHVQSDPRTAPRLDCAMDMAKRFGSAVIGVGAEMIPPLAFDGGVYSMEAEWVTVMRASIDERFKLAHERFRAATQGLDKPLIWTCGLDLPTHALAAASRAADLIVAGGAPRDMHDTYRDCSAAELAIVAGRPVLVAPPQPRRLSARNIVLAWKDTREARRALSDAMPFFEQAEQVIVASVCRDDDAKQVQLQVDDVAAALGRRGVNARAKIAHQQHPNGFDLVDLASRENADLIVCGAYGHSRLGEWVFGGVTNDLLSQDQLFLLLSH